MPGQPSNSHALFALYANTLMAINAFDYADQLVALDYFALRLEQYSSTHMLKNDTDIAAMLYNLRQLMPINPLMLNE